MKYERKVVVTAREIEEEMKTQYDIDIDCAQYILFSDYYDGTCAYLGLGKDADIELEELQELVDTEGDKEALQKIMIIKHMREVFPTEDVILVDCSW